MEMLDQASKLREMVKNIDDRNSNTRIYSVISGKRRSGKTKFAINLENKFRKLGKSVILLDENSDYTKDLLQLSKCDESKREKTIDYLLNLSDYEVVIINNSDELSEESLDFAKFAHEVILVTVSGVTAITETYKFLKVLNQEKIKETVKILVNETENIIKEDTFHNLNETTNRFLDISLEDITDMDSDKLVELLDNSDAYNVVQLRDKITNIFGKEKP